MFKATAGAVPTCRCKTLCGDSGAKQANDPESRPATFQSQFSNVSCNRALGSCVGTNSRTFFPSPNLLWNHCARFMAETEAILLE